MMVTIRKGRATLTVTNGAFREIFKSQGWVLEGSSEIKKASKGKQTSTYEVEDSNLDTEDELEDEEFEEESEDEEEDDLEERPLSELNFDELKALAARYDIDTKGLNSKKLLKEAIKEYRK